MDLRKLKSERAAKAHALETLARKLDEHETAEDLLLFEHIKNQVPEIDRKIKAETAQLAKRAVPLYDPSATSRAAPRRTMNLRSFKDYTDARGTLVRADEQAYGFGKWLFGCVFGHEA